MSPMTVGHDDPIEILLVEDNPGDVRLTEVGIEELQTPVELDVATDGDEALELLDRRRYEDEAALPDLVLLDLNLPRMGGIELLEAIQDDDELTRIPILVLTSSNAAEDIIESYQRAANAYLTKPTDPTEYAELVEAVAEFWFDRAALPPSPS